MAQSGIKKGFFFYFGLFVLLLISIFCICLVVMMFNPGSTVLWMQYFTDNTTIHVVKTNDGTDKTINWKTVKNLEIVCSYADVVVERNSDPSVQQFSVKDANQDGVYIVNHAKGFAAASSAQHFSYTVESDQDSVKIVVNEPTGFLYFSKEVKVVLHATTQKIVTNGAADWDFANLNLKISTKDGDVSVGGIEENKAEEIKMASLDVETDSGDVTFSKLFQTESLNNLNLKSNSGTFSSSREVEDSAQNKANGISLKCDSSLSILGKGKILYNAIVAPGKNLEMTCKNGSWDIAYLEAEEIRCLNCVDGNYLFGEVTGNVIVNSVDSIKSPNIRINKINGNFSLAASQQNNGHPDVEINEIFGNLNFTSDKGNIKVKKAHGGVRVNSQDDLKVDITMADDPEVATATVSILDDKGKVRLAFLNAVPKEIEKDVPRVYVKTKTGDVTIEITKNAKFVANMYVNDDKEGAQRTKIENTNKDKKIILNLGQDLREGETINPLHVPSNEDGTNGSIEIVTNAKIAFNLKEKDELAA